MKLTRTERSALILILEDRCERAQENAQTHLRASDLGMVDHWREQLDVAERLLEKVASEDPTD